MAKRRYSIDEKTIQKRLSEGRGSGLGIKYTPWIYVHEIPSNGISSIRKGWKTGREHHLLSKLEARYFYMLEWDENVADIREQFPLLPRLETIQIAEQLGYEHPKDTRTKTDIVMTTDFVGTVKSGFSNKPIARALKYSKDLEDGRTKEKLLIEKVYWERREIDWGIITEESISKTFVRNVEWLHKSYESFGLFENVSEDIISEIEKYLLDTLPKWQHRLSRLTDHLDENYKIPPGTSLSVVMHLLARKLIKVDMNIIINTCRAVKFHR